MSFACDSCGWLDECAADGKDECADCREYDQPDPLATQLQTQQDGDMATKDTDPVIPPTRPRTSQGEAASGLPEAVVFPYTTPVPAPTTNGANGFRWCHECQSVADVAGHECASSLDDVRAVERLARDYWRDDGHPLSDDFEGRAEFAESLLCAMAFDHAAFLGARLFCVRSRRDPVTHGLGCAFCDAAHGGGR